MSNTSKEQAQETVNELIAKSIGYMDQGHGHGHYGFNPLTQEEFYQLRLALETLGCFGKVKP